MIDSENDQETRRSITKASITKQMRGEDWDDANEEANNKTISDIYIAKMQRLLNSKGKLHMIDIPSLMYPVSSFEANARQIYKEDTNSGAVVIPRKVYKQLIRDNESAIRRFASSKFSSSHRAFKSAFETSE